MSNINYVMKGNSLSQGVNFNNHMSKYIDIVGKKSLKLIEQTTGANLESLHENMDVMDNPITKKEELEISKLKALESEFNVTLQEYKDNYQLYLTHVANQSENIEKNSNINVQDPGGKFYYVNQYGYTRGYSNTAWDNKPSTCLQSTPDSASKTIYKTLSNGVDYNSGQPCNLDGKLLRNSQTNHLAWISPEGKRHFYPNESIYENANKNGGCPFGNEILVSNEVFNMFPPGDDMTDETKCFTNNKDSSLMNTIVTLNSRLMAISQEMYNIVKNMDKEDDTLDNVLTNQKQTLMTEMTTLNNERNKFVDLEKSMQKLNGEYDNIQLVTNMEYLQYIGWTVGAVATIIFAAKHMTS